MTFADVGDVRLFYTVDGDGPPLLFVHGYTCDSHDWSWQLPHFAAKHTVVAVDLRGHGRSSAPEKGYSAGQFAADLAGLLTELGLEGVTAVGHSLGAIVASVLAVEYPSLVSAVVVVDPPYLLRDEAGPHLEPIIAALQGPDPAPVIQQMLAGSDTPATDPALKAWHQRRVAGVPPHVLRQAFEAGVYGFILRSVSEPYLRRRTGPVLAVYADPDRAAAEAKLLSGPSRAVGWGDGAGHWLHQERPADFNATVSAWLATIAR
jgi:pimeloyl-ACP methyl ester carboxylesterase